MGLTSITNNGIVKLRKGYIIKKENETKMNITVITHEKDLKGYFTVYKVLVEAPDVTDVKKQKQSIIDETAVKLGLTRTTIFGGKVVKSAKTNQYIVTIDIA